jgi:NADH:ubiquinone oxidoreductase subunit 6 (subunit J)
VTLEQVIFILVSLLTLGTGIVVVTNRNLFHAALAMMASFLGVAGLYILLDAGFLAAAQLLVYIGAISILIIFAIMLTRRMMQAREAAVQLAKWVGADYGRCYLCPPCGRDWSVLVGGGCV